MFCLLLTEGSPTRSRSPEPQLFPGFLSSGADMLRRKIVGGEDQRPSRISTRNKILLSRQEKRALNSLRLMEKVESLGLDSIMTGHQPVGISPLAIQTSSPLSGGGVRSRTASPMAQLTSLKNISAHDANTHPHFVDRGTIKSVLSKGFSSDSLQSLGSCDSNDGGNSECSANSTLTERSKRLPSTSSPQQQKPAPPQDTTKASPAKPNLTDIRLKQMQRQKSRRGLLNGQRPDLGTVAGKTRPDLGTVGTNSSQQTLQQAPAVTTATQPQSIAQSFVGSISSLFYGRKGGLL